MGMEILINGQPDLAATDDDVELGALFGYLRNEFARQRLVIRQVLLDGNEIHLDENAPELKQSPAKFSKCEIEVAPVEIVAIDVLMELEANVPELANRAILVTELLQKSEFKAARTELQKFIDSTHYVSQAVKMINGLTGIDLTEKLANTGMRDDLKLLGEHLGNVEKSLAEEDYATVGDVMEFDVSPSVGTLVGLIRVMREEVEQKAREKFPEMEASE